MNTSSDQDACQLDLFADQLDADNDQLELPFPERED